jgi:hypothetical protein
VGDARHTNHLNTRGFTSGNNNNLSVQTGVATGARKLASLPTPATQTLRTTAKLFSAQQHPPRLRTHNSQGTQCRTSPTTAPKCLCWSCCSSSCPPLSWPTTLVRPPSPLSTTSLRRCVCGWPLKVWPLGGDCAASGGVSLASCGRKRSVDGSVSATSVSACVLAPEMTEGPYYWEDLLARRNITYTYTLPLSHHGDNKLGVAGPSH